METTTKIEAKFFLVKGGYFNRQNLVMTNGLSFLEIKEKTLKYFPEIGGSPLREVGIKDIPKRFLSGVKMVEDQSFTICLVQMYNKNTLFLAKWLTTSREKKVRVLTA